MIPSHTVTFGKKTIQFEVKYSNRRTLAIQVNPDLTVVVVAPYGTEVEPIKARVSKRAAWILKQQDFFEAFLPQTPPRRYVSGEACYYLGKQYRLKVVQMEETESVKLQGPYIFVRVRDKANARRIETLLTDWYRSHARTRFHTSLLKCWEVLRKYEVPLPQMRLRKMHKRWGSCSPQGVVYLNPELVKVPSHCIDYVILHELCHLKHPDHSPRFFHLLGLVLPDWKQRKARLEQFRS